MLWGLRLPHAILADQGVGEDDELAGDGDEGGLWRFAGGSQALVEGAHIGIEARGAEGGEIEDAAHAGAAAEDDASAVAFSRLIGDRREAGEHSALFGGDAAELGETSDQDCRGEEAEAWDRGQDGVAPRQILV